MIIWITGCHFHNLLHGLLKSIYSKSVCSYHSLEKTLNVILFNEYDVLFLSFGNMPTATKCECKWRWWYWNIHWNDCGWSIDSENEKERSLSVSKHSERRSNKKKYLKKMQFNPAFLSEFTLKSDFRKWKLVFLLCFSLNSQSPG